MCIVSLYPKCLCNFPLSSHSWVHLLPTSFVSKLFYLYIFKIINYINSDPPAVIGLKLRDKWPFNFF